MARRKTRIDWNIKAFEDIRRLPGVDARLRKEVDARLAAAGDGYAGGVEPGRTRSRGFIVTATGKAMRDQSRNHTLQRVLGGGAGG